MARKKKSVAAVFKTAVDAQAFRRRAIEKNISFARAEDKETPYWKQADTELNTEDAKNARMALRSHPAVLQALIPWWQTSKRCAEVRIPHTDRLARPDYKDLCIRLYKALIDEWDEDEAYATAEEDCEEDCGGQAYITRQKYESSLFELADMWSHDIDGKEYATLLWQLYSCITDGATPGTATWKAIQDCDHISSSVNGRFGRFGDKMTEEMLMGEEYLETLRLEKEAKRKAEAERIAAEKAEKAEKIAKQQQEQQRAAEAAAAAEASAKAAAEAAALAALHQSAIEAEMEAMRLAKKARAATLRAQRKQREEERRAQKAKEAFRERQLAMFKALMGGAATDLRGKRLYGISVGAGAGSNVSSPRSPLHSDIDTSLEPPNLNCLKSMHTPLSLAPSDRRSASSVGNSFSRPHTSRAAPVASARAVGPLPSIHMSCGGGTAAHPSFPSSSTRSRGNPVRRCGEGEEAGEEEDEEETTPPPPPRPRLCRTSPRTPVPLSHESRDSHSASDAAPGSNTAYLRAGATLGEIPPSHTPTRLGAGRTSPLKWYMADWERLISIEADNNLEEPHPDKCGGVAHPGSPVEALGQEALGATSPLALPPQTDPLSAPQPAASYFCSPQHEAPRSPKPATTTPSASQRLAAPPSMPSTLPLPASKLPKTLRAAQAVPFTQSRPPPAVPCQNQSPTPTAVSMATARAESPSTLSLPSPLPPTTQRFAAMGKVNPSPRASPAAQRPLPKAREMMTETLDRSLGTEHRSPPGQGSLPRPLTTRAPAVAQLRISVPQPPRAVINKGRYEYDFAGEAVEAWQASPESPEHLPSKQLW